MKLRLNLSLRRSLMAAFTLAATLFSGHVAYGSVLVSTMGMQTYTDFGQNYGRYQAGQVNALLSAIRARDGGVKIYYQGDKFADYSYTMEHGMIDFSSSSTAAVDTSIGYGFLATVQHNGVQNPMYAAKEVGDSNAVRYYGIEYRNGSIGLGGAANQPFLLAPATDHKITRLSKLITDVRTADVYNNYDMLGQSLAGQLLYRAGSGSMYMATVDENGYADMSAPARLHGAYSYVTGGIITIDTWNQRETQEGGDFNYSACHTVSNNIYGYITGTMLTNMGVESGQLNPLPYCGRAGDSGSPSWVWNEQTQTYQYISALQSGAGAFTQDRGAWAWTLDTMESFNRTASLGDGSLIRLTGVTGYGETISGQADNTIRETTERLGSVVYSVDGKEQKMSFAGVATGVNTWLALNDIKDTDNWYNYNNSYLNASGTGAGKDLTYADLMYTNSIVLKAGEARDYTVQLDDTVDTGIGYVQFSKEAGVDAASFTIVAQAGERNLLNTAGFVVDAGVTVNIDLTNPANYVREWRKVGAGDLHIIGSGDNNILLNVGGNSVDVNNGTTAGYADGRVFLEREGGYAAYNVLASTGSTVILKDIGQVKRDVTLGAGGATLDLNGNDYTWNNASTADGFTLHMLSEKDILANHGAGAAKVTVTDAGSELLGSFEDSATGALQVSYDGGENHLEMHSIFTDLSHNKDSRFSVESGSVGLSGTVTVHGKGSLSGTSAERLVNPDDWHYADAKMNVTVNGGTFTLGDHARLTGDVTVNEGGTFVMKQGTNKNMEFIEGGLWAEDTQSAFYSQFHGLKGNIAMAGGELRVAYDQGTTSHNSYAGNITGEASAISFDLGTEATLSLSGTNDFTVKNGGSVQLISGGVVAEKAESAGYVNGSAAHTWIIGEKGYLAVKGLSGDALLSLVSADSAGVLALTESQHAALNGVPSGLFIGALEGTRVEYGAAGTTDELAPTQTGDYAHWLLGGGGGELVVNFRLNDETADLILGNAYTTGSVTLTNEQNNIGNIIFAGKVTLGYTSEAALGGSTIALNYGNRIIGSASAMNSLTADSEGAMLLDNMADADVSMAGHTALSLGATGKMTYNGTIDLGGGDTYRFGGISGHLSLANSLADGTGRTNLVVDGQQYSGGVLELLAAATLTGDVSVKGYDPAKTGEETTGDITLRLSVQDALASAASVSVTDGGIIDVNGTHQQLNNLSMGEGSLLTDSSSSGKGVADIRVDAGKTTSLNGAVEVNTLTKSGSGTLNLGGSNSYGLFNIAGGKVVVTDNAAFENTGVTNVQTGATLDVSGISTAGNTALSGGTLKVGANLSGSVYAASGTSVVNNNGESSKIAADLAVAEGAKMMLSGGTYQLTNAVVNPDSDDEKGGTIAVTANRLEIVGNELTTIGGTLSLDGTGKTGNKVTLYSDRSGDNTTRDIAHLHVAGNYNTNLTISENTWNTIWNIHKLSGTGNITWDSSTTHYYSSRLVLDGEGDFSGTLLAQRSRTNNDGRSYSSYLELAHQKAVQRAYVNLVGANAYNTMNLALNAEAIDMLNLSGNTYTTLYAGAAVEGDKSVAGSLNAAPVSTRKTTLTFMGNANATFSGNVYGGENGNGISLVMNAAQDSVTQTFNGKHIDFNDLTVKRGNLAITTDDLSIAGDLTVESGSLTIKSTNMNVAGNIVLHTGASLKTGSRFVLSEDVSFSVAGENTATATFGSVLLLDGGQLSFDSSALSADHAALDIAGVSYYNAMNPAMELTLNFNSTGALRDEVAYQLMTGSWDAGSIGEMQFNAKGVGDYMQAAFSAREDGLFVTFHLNEGVSLWHGTDEDNALTATHFSAGTTTAVFNDTAANRDVRVTENVAFDHAIIDTDQRYNFSAEGGKAQFGSLTKEKSGEAVLESGSVEVSGDTLINGGKLTVQDTETLKGSVSGEGTLGVDFGEKSGAIAGLGSIGTLEVQSGRYEATTALSAGTVKVLDGASVLVGGAQTAAFELAGTGRSADNGALIMEKGSAVSGKVSLTDNAAVNVAAGSASLSAVDTGANTLTKTGAGTLNLKSTDVSGSIHLTEGALQLGAVSTYQKLRSIEMEKGTVFNVVNNNITGLSLSMHDGAEMGIMGYSTVVAAITVDGAATIKGSYNSNGGSVNGTVTGNGTLNLLGNGSNTWALNSGVHDGANAKLALNVDSTNVRITGANSYSGGTTIVSGSVTTAATTALGTGGVTLQGGSLNLNASLAVDGLSGEGGSVNLNGNVLALSGGTPYTYGGSISGGSVSLRTGVEQSFTGETALQSVSLMGGKLTLNDASVSDGILIYGAGTVVLNGTISLGAAIDNWGGTVELGEGMHFNIDSSKLTAGSSYTLISAMEGLDSTISGNVSLDNIYVDGISLSGYAAQFNLVQENSTLTFSYSGALDRIDHVLTWNGSDGSWDNSGDKGWLNGSNQVTGSTSDDSVVFGAAGDKNVAIGAGVAIKNMTVAEGNYTFTGMENLTVSGKLTIAEGASVKADSLASLTSIDLGGTLKLNVTKNTTLNTALEAAGNTKGTLVKNGSATLTVAENTKMSLGGLVVEQGTVQITRNNTVEKSIGKLTMDGGTTLVQHSAVMPTGFMTIGSLELNGNTATLQENHNAGAISVGALTMAEGVDSATLKLVNNAASNRTSVFALGGAEGSNFKGTIEVSSITPTGEQRNAVVVLNDADVAKGARINLASTSRASSKLGIGVHADAVTVAGLSSNASLGSRAFIFSGTAPVNGSYTATAVETTDANAVRTLTVNTAKGTDDTFNGMVGAKLNLVKDGEGKQTFAGTSDGFNGSLTVKDGTLALKDNAAKMLAQASSVAVSGGTLEVAPAADVTVNSLSMTGGALKLQKGESSVTLTAIAETGTISKLTMGANADGSLTVAGSKGTVLNNIAMDLSGDTQLNLSDIVFAATSKLTDDTAFVNVSNVTFVAELGVNTTVENTITDSITLASSAKAGETLEILEPGYTMSLTLSSIENVKLDGTNLTIDLVGVEEDMLAATQYIKLNLSGEATFATTLDVTLTWNGNSAVGYYEAGNTAAVYFDRSGLCAPEPATATLSLLALAALAARRRRK